MLPERSSKAGQFDEKAKSPSPPTRRERRKLWRACRKLGVNGKELVEALNAKAQLLAQRKGPPGPKPETVAVDAEGREVAL